ncbi:MAG: ABC transporter ATP-binding protein, partial [Candidatus Thorarchaeota archaeon]
MSRLAGGDQERETPDRILISKLFFKYVLPYKIAFSIALVVMLISVVFDLMGPYIIKIAIDDYIIPDKPFNLIILIAIFYVFVQAISFILEFIRLYIATVTGQKVVHQIRSDLIGNLQNLGMDYFDKNETGRIISKTTNDTERLSDLLTSGVLDVIVNSFQVIGILIILFSFDASLSLVTIFVTPIILLIIFVFRKKARPVYQLTRRTIGSVTASFQENISGITVSQIFNREEKNIDEFDKVNQDNFNARLKSIFIFSLLFPSLDAINGIAVAFIILIGANALLTGSSTITVGVLVALLGQIWLISLLFFSTIPV